MKRGNFTLPGESGYEDLTLELASKWGADVIRDSDGTSLSGKLLDAGYEIYSTICCIRGHNAWAAKHPQDLQQTFLMSDPVIARDSAVSIHLTDGYLTEQFRVNDSPESVKLWQVFDRTAQSQVPGAQWQYEAEAGNVVITGTVPYHQYTVNFLAYRIWEEISMYNHITNGWTSEHLMPIDPRSRAAQEYLLAWMESWCKEHPDTDTVRFTSLFYNFVWIWGSDPKRQNRFTDWGSYDFTVSPLALREFEKQYGYALTSEDFIHQGKRHATHMPPDKKLLDYIEFTTRFVTEFGRKLVDIVHAHGKKALLFYDDSWVGTEPYSRYFPDMNFDGIIKCVFSGYEVRLCGNVPTKIHEIRLHPYLFPTGLGGAPTFSEGGHPERDAMLYWTHIRRALLRQCVDRIGLGGYLHLVKGYPEFVDCIGRIADEFRRIQQLQKEGDVYTLPIRVAVLHAWGKLRSWTLSGHFHETYMQDLIHINEALAGLPLQVSFVDFDDVKRGELAGVDVVINAGRAGTAWSGGDAWKDPEVVAELTRWTEEGGVFIGVNEPSAAGGAMSFFRMAHVLGVDEDTGARVCEGRYAFTTKEEPGLIPADAYIHARRGRILTDGAHTDVVAGQTLSIAGFPDPEPALTMHPFGEGMGVYLSSFAFTYPNARMLLNIILKATGHGLNRSFLPDNPWCECAYYPSSQVLVVVNNSQEKQQTNIRIARGTAESRISLTLSPLEMKFLELAES